MRALRMGLALGTLALVAGFVFWEHERGGGPGPLTTTHARVPELADSEGCVRCHGEAPSALAAACVVCHAAVGEQMTKRRGLHGTLAAATAKACGSCHREHHGDEVALVDAKAFAKAGVAEPERYDHAGLDFGLTGAHAGLRCVACHRRAEARVLAQGEQRYLGLTQRCADCHEDKHRGALGEDCAACHGQELPFPQVAALEHDPRFPLRGGHAGRACRDCHAAEGGHSLEALASRRERGDTVPVRACASCHANPHAPDAQGVAAGTRRLVLARSEECGRCHGTERFADVRFGADEHRAIGVVLVGAHAQAACTGCHGPERADRLAAAPERAAILGRCTECHASPHRPGYVAAATAGAGSGPDAACARCHDPARATWQEVDEAAARAAHVGVSFALAAPHAKVACSGCHAGTGVAAAPAGAAVAGFAARYPGREADACQSCHADPHRGQFAKGAFAGQGCLSCHARTGFVPPEFSLAQHARTAFPLDGAHAATPCTACHGTSAEAGGARSFAGTPTRCDACHRDAHGGAFERKGVPQRVAGREGCARCHDTEAFRPVRAAFDHAAWTGYDLRGAHKRAACAGCHPADPARPGIYGRPASRECASCHVDPHAGQFRSGPRNDCARCHAEDEMWRRPHFDHGRDARFRLDATHARLACSACHKAYELPEGGQVIRYRPLGTACADCHDPRRLREFGKR
ncbi:MAG: cytochrome c3 family protein [Planctomycetes bacterium]|nr:cytochrome c3 family protein [Planctomycetota bacterium]